MKNPFAAVAPIVLIGVLTGCASDDSPTTRQMLSHLPTPTSASTAANQSAPVNAIATLPNAAPSIELFDSTIFDNQLSSLLDKHPAAVIVRTTGDATTNNLPDRLEKWLAYIDKKGGTVKFEHDPEEKERIIGDILIDFAVDLVAKYYDHLLYSPAKHYNATVYYKNSGTISRVVFAQHQ